jgi:hypothetical protein
MKRGFYILLLGFLYLLLTAKSCDSGEEVRDRVEKIRSDAERDSIAKAARNEVPDGNALQAFEMNAVRMVYDLWDYRRIAMDSSSAPEFRRTAEKMAQGMFLPGIPLPAMTGKRGLDSAWVMYPLVRTGDTIFSGELGLKLEDGITGKQDKTAWKSAEIAVVRQSRIFGKDTLLSWRVFLGKFH